MFKVINVMGYSILKDKLTAIKISKNKKIIINTINSHSYVTSKKDKEFRESLNKSDLLIPDGSGITLASKFLNREAIDKIAGYDLHHYLLEELNKNTGKCFYMGSSSSTLKKISERLSKEFPNVEVETYSPPFKAKFTEEENAEIIARINAFEPEVLFVGMTAPKQEKWLQANRNQLKFNIASSIGAVFDFYAGTVQRPSEFWIKAHLEFLPRLLSEPKRLWRRNFISTPLFIFEFFLYKLAIKKSKLLTYSPKSPDLAEQAVNSH
jgi:N-acetylglucosaminyldiphosphoundecaprenol N-acetyl-beta-D-mannosaminyltransferase